MQTKLMTDEELVAAINQKRITTGTIGKWRRAKKIPFVRLGYRSCFYDFDKVMASLMRREVKANGQR